MTATAFDSLRLPAELLDNLHTLGYHQMTPVQAESLPPMLEGRDVLALAKTGSGKTAAFGLALLAGLDASAFRVERLVLCPTRELAEQVADELRRLARGLANVKVLTLCGGQPMGPQLASLAHGANIVVGTPGRIEEHLRKGSLTIDTLRMLVLDEADRMLDMGFQAEIDAIVAATPASRQTLLFSATFVGLDEGDDAQLSQGLDVVRDPVVVRVAERHAADTIDQRFYAVGDDRARYAALRQLLLHHRPERSLIFCNTKRETQSLADGLAADGFGALAIHGDLEQPDRERRLILFSQRSASILVATDVAARGLDIAELDCVFNYRLASDPDVHVHRVGRTGRGGASGVAHTLVGDAERHRLERFVAEGEPLPSMSALPNAGDATPFAPPMATLQIGGGKKDKLRPGDILGALTSPGGLAGEEVGAIKILARSSYVAVNREAVRRAIGKLEQDKLKGRHFRVRHVRH